MSKTLFDKIWEKHIVKKIDDGPSVLYIDRHFIHEVTSPQAFTGLNKRGIKVFRPQQTVATADHNVPTPCSAQFFIKASTCFRLNSSLIGKC